MKYLLLPILLIAAPALADEESIREIVLNNAEHTLWHEAGHALVSEFELPVIGQEEDAVDGFATLEMMSDKDAAHIERLLDVAELWLISHETADVGGDLSDYYSEHDLDAQRGLRVICFIAGEGPGRAHELSAQWGLPEERSETCEFDYTLALDSWDALLEPLHRPDGEPAATITVEYAQASSPWRDILKDSELLEYVGEYMAATYGFEDGMTFEARECGEANAYWDPGTRTVTLCYELLEDYEELARIAVEG